MANNPDQVCVISVVFPCPDDARAFDIKGKIQELVADQAEAKVDFRLVSGQPRGPLPHG